MSSAQRLRQDFIPAVAPIRRSIRLDVVAPRRRHLSGGGYRIEVTVRADPTERLDVTPANTAGRRRIWLCADDFGISNSVNLAIRDLVVRGRLNATSVLVVAPSFSRSEAMSLNTLNSVEPRVAIGLHLGLTAPFQPLSKSFRPVSGGAFLPLAATARHAAMRRFDHDTLVAEITLQMQTFLSTFGRAPDFVDGHQHVHLLPQISDALLTVVKETLPDAGCDNAAALSRLRHDLPTARGCSSIS